MSYDKNNIFAKILRKEIPCKKIFENEHVLSFHDINHQKKIVIRYLIIGSTRDSTEKRNLIQYYLKSKFHN